MPSASPSPLLCPSELRGYGRRGLPSGGMGVGHEVTVERLGRRPVDVLPHEVITHDLAHAADLFATSLEARIGDGHVDEIEKAVHRRAFSLGVSLASCPAGTRHLAACVAELLHQRHGVPAAGGKTEMMSAHG